MNCEQKHGVHERCEQACLILKNTHDGDDLCPRELQLVEGTVNGWLTETGWEAFTDLYTRVKNGTYQKPWFHGIEHLTFDHTGYVSWKGVSVEHYSSPWAWSQEGKVAAEELAAACRRLEAEGREITGFASVAGYLLGGKK